jgi:arylsulfatase A-like enzyme
MKHLPILFALFALICGQMRAAPVEKVVFLISDDHGYHLGDHDFWQKASLREQVTRVPLVIVAPGIEPGRSDSIVQLVDLFPTLCELTGAPIPEGVERGRLHPGEFGQRPVRSPAREGEQTGAAE